MERGNSISTASREDRISNLPESLIHHILSFLSDTTYAVQTCVLSKRWQYIWTSLPVLKFSDDYHYRDSDVEEEEDGFDHEDMFLVNRFIGFVDKICIAARSREKQFYAQRTMGLLRGIRSVKVLTLNFSILKNLELQTDQTCFLKDCLCWVFYILKSSPNIESVSLRLSQHPDEPPLHEYHEEVKFNPKNIGGDYWDAELSSSCMICHLKFVEINGLCGCADELKFLEILLKHATVLEKVVLASDSTEQDSQQKIWMAEFSEMLLKLPTASKNILIVLTS